MINHDKPIWWRDRRRDRAWKSSPRSTGLSSPDSNWHSRFLTHFQTNPHRHLMDGRKNAWMDGCTCWKHGQMERSKRWRCSYPWDSELAITLRRWFFFLFCGNSQISQRVHIGSIGENIILQPQEPAGNVWPAAPSYPPSRSPNTSPELRSKTAPTAYCWVSVRLRPASAIWSAFTWPSLGQWRQWLVTTGDGWATYISATASQVSYISLKKWSASFDWGHVEGKKLRKYNNVWSWKYHQRCFGTRG